MKTRPSFEKRRKEMQRKERKLEKAQQRKARREQRGGLASLDPTDDSAAEGSPLQVDSVNGEQPVSNDPEGTSATPERERRD